MSLLQWIDRIDKVLLVMINHDSDHALLDNVMPALRNPYTWVPLYVFMLWYVLTRRKSDALPFICLSVLTFAITDSVTASVLKPFFERPRPCCDPALQGAVRALADCGGYNSFPSSHAANHFGLATFWFWSLWLMTGKKWRWLWVWAIAICYAQVYVGKHYPSDVVAGGLFGWATGLISAKLFHRWAFPFDKEKDESFPKKEHPGSVLLQNQL